MRGKSRKCLSIYYYVMDRELGLIYVKVQTWFPMAMQSMVEGALPKREVVYGFRYSE